MVHRSKYPAFILVLSIMLLLLLQGCGSGTQAPSNNNPPASPPATQPPAADPKIEACLNGIPVYPGAQKNPAEDETGLRAYLTADTVDQVTAFYDGQNLGTGCQKKVDPKARTPKGNTGKTTTYTCNKDNLTVIVALLLRADGQPGTNLHLKCIAP
jgi:hypothetical protein